jgi:hypothetical protein
VRKKAKPEELNSILQKAHNTFRGGVEMSTEECKRYRELAEVLEGRKKAPSAEGLREITDMQKRDIVKMVKALLEFCKSRTEQNFLNLVRLGHDKDTRTCLVSSNAFKQRFRFVSDNISGRDSWVTEGAPEGPCGFVQLSRFEPDPQRDSKLVFWKYVARKAVTNPQGSFFPGTSCKGFDEGEYLYDWKDKERFLGCDYIEFSPL